MGLRTKFNIGCVWRLTSGLVPSGPFKGMRYLPDVVGSTLAPKLIGTYERELHGAISRIIAASPSLVINVGAAEGYYAVGLARAIPSCRVIAFETEQKGQRLIRELAELNNVASRVQVEGSCDVATLAGLLQSVGPAALIMDIEGGEKEVLDPQKIPGLTACLVLVEVHESKHQGLESTLLQRFSPTHQVTRFAQMDRVSSDFPMSLPVWAKLLGNRFLSRAMNEKRANRVSWLFMENNAVI